MRLDVLLVLDQVAHAREALVRVRVRVRVGDEVPHAREALPEESGSGLGLGLEVRVRVRVSTCQKSCLTLLGVITR